MRDGKLCELHLGLVPLVRQDGAVAVSGTALHGLDETGVVLMYSTPELPAYWYTS